MVTSLSIYEMKLVTDPDVLLTKNKIIQKVHALFGGLAEDYENVSKACGLFTSDPIDAKISRGENYKGLPYVVLDYPRQFGKLDVFAIRTFFWWGNFFSITLQLGGEYQHKYSSAIEKAIDKNLFEDWFIGCGDDPWDHHFENNNYTPIQQGKKYFMPNLSYLKIAKKIPLDKWDEADYFFKENFIFLIKVLCS
ncbi:MAG: hypothetical protein JWQ09_2066 [Segetibacter sp.]|nr:hypothetical protein [Segetibacter sp.]